MEDSDWQIYEVLLYKSLTVSSQGGLFSLNRLVILLRINRLLFLALLLLPLRAALADRETPSFALLLPLTGSEASSGEDCRRGIEVARSVAPEKTPLELIYADTRRVGKQGISEYRRLVSTSGTIGSLAFASSVAMPLNPISKREQTPLLGISGHADLVKQNPYAFRFWPSTRLEGKAIADKVLAAGKRKAAIITLQDEWLLSLTEQFRRVFEAGGGSVVFTDQVQAEDSDFRALALRIKTSKPDVIFVNMGSNHMGAMVKQLRDLRLKQLLIGNYLARRADVIKSAGAAAIEGILFPEVNTAKPKFLALHQQLFAGQSVTAATYTCYAATEFLLQSMKQQPEEALKNAGSLHAVFSQVQKIELLDETMNIEQREAQFDVSIRTIRRGVVETL